MEKYVLVTWPLSQSFMESERFDECFMVSSVDGNDGSDECSYMVPENLYNSIMNKSKV